MKVHSLSFPVLVSAFILPSLYHALRGLGIGGESVFFISTFPRYNSQPPHRGTFPQAGRLAAFRQHRTIPALRLKHRSGS
ncbi:hypothetical protein, partial [Gemmiger sp.]|uniref:hypothetical protein n=1 Tax=Gemmiger sp. TaxID=2049027 RepID=UPI0025BB0EE6